MNFKPTYLYIKQHSVTGKLYFGKTIRNPEKYNGSGVRWKYHIRKYGTDKIVTLWYCLFLDQESCTEFAELCSNQWNITESIDWLNLSIENGIDGDYGLNGDKNPAFGKPSHNISKIAIHKVENIKYIKKDELDNHLDNGWLLGSGISPHGGKFHTNQTKNLMSLSKLGVKKSESHIENMKKSSRKGKENIFFGKSNYNTVLENHGKEYADEWFIRYKKQSSERMLKNNPATGKKRMFKNDINVYVAKDDVEKFLNDGWKLGMVKCLKS